MNRIPFLIAAMILTLSFCLSATPLWAGTAQLTWEKPTTDADGGPLAELTGYRIYYGTTARSGNMPPGGYNGGGSPITIVNPDQLTYTFNNLEDGHVWYFSVTAYNSGGESFFSNEGSKQLCAYSLSLSQLTVGASGGSGSVTVTTQGGCAWTAVSNVPWVSITGGSSGTGSGTVQYSAAANAGAIRSGTLTIAGETLAIVQGTSSTLPQIGVFLNGSWYMDSNGSGGWNGSNTDSFYANFGSAMGAVPVVGDWDGTGISRIGVFWKGQWYFDMNRNGIWDGASVDRYYANFGSAAGAVPVVGDWTGAGTTNIGVFLNGAWYLDLNGNGIWDGASVDRYYANFGSAAGAIPVVGDWNGSGTDKVGVFWNGQWYFDLNGNGIWDGVQSDRYCASFGAAAGAKPVVGNWGGGAITKIGAFLNGAWYLDLNGNCIWDGPSTDILYHNFGSAPGVVPVVGR